MKIFTSHQFPLYLILLFATPLSAPSSQTGLPLPGLFDGDAEEIKNFPGKG